MGITLAVILGGIAALGPARTASRMVPIDALRDRRPRHAVGRTHRRLTERRRPGVACARCGPRNFYVLNTPIPAYATDPYATGYGSARRIRSPRRVLRRRNDHGGGWHRTFDSRANSASLGTSAGMPVWRLALRDTADHPSRTVPAILGVVFSLLAASYVLVYAASMFARIATEPPPSTGRAPSSFHRR